METRLAHRSPSSSLHDGRQFMNAVAHVPKRARGISPLMRSEYQALSEREDGTNVGLRSRSPHTVLDTGRAPHCGKCHDRTCVLVTPLVLGEPVSAGRHSYPRSETQGLSVFDEFHPTILGAAILRVIRGNRFVRAETG